MEFKKSMNHAMATLNNSPILAGLAMLMLNIGSKYVEIGLSKTQEQALRNGIARELLIFAMVFMGTKNIVLSIIMTASFIILSEYIFNEKSQLCIIPGYMRRISMEVDLNGDNVISKDEEEKAIAILQKAKHQKKNKIQAEFVSYLPSQQFASI
uniref:EF-hand domain-containing protein n=1 Tax=viral metagenome TaxID=1070528 RepID=A0A6C0LJD0_9ZZZZ